MRARRRRSIVLGSVGLAALALGPVRLGAQTPLTPGSWEFFEWFVSPGPVEGSGFTIGSATDQILIRLTDTGTTGDAFDVFVNGALALSTPGVAPEILTGVFDADAAFGDPRLSSGQLLLAPGNYLVTLVVREHPPGFLDGFGYIRGDFVRQPTVIPEPATLLLVAPGLMALAVAWRRRRA